MIVPFKKILKEVKDYKNGKIKSGISLGDEEIDKRIRFKRQFNVILGHANAGKTTLVIYLMLLYSINKNLKFLIYSSENDLYDLAMRLIEFKEVKPISKIPDSDLEEAAEFIDQHFKFVDNSKLYHYQELLSIGETVKKEYDFDGFLIDPYNSLVREKEQMSGISSHEYDYVALSKFRLFCQDNNVALWLCTHANTEAARRRHPLGHRYAGQTTPPSAADCEGGQKFKSRCSDFWVIHRYIDDLHDWKFSHLHVEKVKTTQSGGSTTKGEPILFESIKNNVGFAINQNKLLTSREYKQKNFPF